MEPDAGYGRKQHVVEALLRAIITVEILRAAETEL